MIFHKMKNRIKIIETGYEDNPGIFTGRITKENKLRFESTLFRDSCYLRLTRSQARRLAEFLLDFVENK